MAGEYINHFGSVRLRVTGSGTLKLNLSSLDDEFSIDLPNIVMASGTNKYPNVLCNFVQSQAKLTISTENINEVFLIKEIIIYTKPIFNSYPQ